MVAFFGNNDVYVEEESFTDQRDVFSVIAYCVTAIALLVLVVFLIRAVGRYVERRRLSELSAAREEIRELKGKCKTRDEANARLEAQNAELQRSIQMLQLQNARP